jgi:hypothetical protein
MEEYKEAGIWDYFLRLVNVQEYKLSKKQESIQLLAYSAASFVIPMVLKQPQILVGSFVNMMLILSALNLRGKKLLPVIILPSLGVLAGGYLFGGLAASLFYLLPFIWIGNTILVLAFKHFKLHEKKNFFLTLGIGSAAKAGFLFGVTSILVSLSIVPVAFLTTMGALQLVTAITGGTLAFTVQKARLT